LVRKIGEATALEVRASGIHYTFAPCVAVSINAFTQKKKYKSQFLLGQYFFEVVAIIESTKKLSFRV
jgi:hypothetical protein